VTAFASVAQLRAYLPQVSEDGVQLVTIAGATGGTFTLTYEGVSTAALAWNATATVVQAALRGITAIGSGGVNVKGRPGGPYTVSFQGTLATDAAPLTASAASLTPASTITIAPASDTVLQQCLDRATDIVRSALRSLLADPTFDYAAYGAASTKIVKAYDSHYLSIPAYQAGSVTLVEYQSGSYPSTYTTLTADQWEAQADGRLYRASGWGGGYWGDLPRYRMTAVWGWGPTPPDSVVEVTVEAAVNIWRSRDKGGFIETVGADGAGAVRVVTGLTKQQQLTLETLRDQLIDIGV